MYVGIPAAEIESNWTTREGKMPSTRAGETPATQAKPFSHMF